MKCYQHQDKMEALDIMEKIILDEYCILTVQFC